MATREYEADGLRVQWDAARCIHVAACIRALPRVFKGSKQSKARYLALMALPFLVYLGAGILAAGIAGILVAPLVLLHLRHLHQQHH